MSTILFFKSFNPSLFSLDILLCTTHAARLRRIKMRALCRPRRMASIAAMLFLSNGNMFGMASSVTDLSRRQNMIDPLTQGSHRDMVGIDTVNSNNTLQSWDINYVNFTADLSQYKDDELEMYLEITKGRSYESELLGGDCAENITGIDYNTTTPVVTSKSDTHDYLRLGYSIDKSMIAGSSIWNDTSDKIEVCQIVRLVLVTDETPPMTMIIAQIKNRFIINVDFSMDFTVATYLEYVGMKLTMTIPGELELGAYVIPDNQEDVNNDAAIFEKTITEGAQGAIGPNTSWAVVNTTINTIGESNVTTDTRRLSDVDNAAFDAPGGEQRGLQSTTMVKFDLFLEEPCDDMDDCKELMTTTNMYADVWSHMNGTVFDGGFFDILNAVALKASSVTRERTLMQEDAIDAVAAGDEDHHRSLQLNMTDIEVRRLTLYDPTMAVWEPISNIGTASGSTDVFSYVRACKCDGAQYFNCNENVPLAPNNELFVCIWSIRSSEVEIDYLDSMVSIAIILCPRDLCAPPLPHCA